MYCCIYQGLTGGLAAPLVAAGAGAVIGGAGAAALGSAAGVAIIGSLFGVAGAGLTGKMLQVVTLTLCNIIFSSYGLTLLLLELKVISLCHQYRAWPACSSV